MLLDLNLPQLQNLIRRDPTSYRDEFLRQWHHFQSSLEILKLAPTSPVKDFEELVLFLAHVAYCYPDEMVGFAPQLIDLLRNSFTTLHPDVRKALVQSLMLLRSKNNADQLTVLSLFFHLLRCHDKTLRSTMVAYIITDIRNANHKTKNNRLNKALQNHMFGLITGADADAAGDASDIAAKYCLDIAIELYRKNVWNDNKTVNVIAEALFSGHMKVLVAALKFFLGGDVPIEDPESDNDDLPDIKAMQFRATFTKKSKGNKTKLVKAMKQVKRKGTKDKKAEVFNFSALHLINDPQGLAEKIFHRLERRTVSDSANTKVTREIKFDVRLMMMNLISRIIGIHKLIIFGVYPYFIKYLKPHQTDVTMVLAICAQASHELVPPDAIEEVIRVIINNFVTDAFAPEVIAAGLNAIREICSRCPLAIEEELLHYCVTFKNHRDKGASMACRSLISLYREVNPELLPARERGKVAAMGVSRGEISKIQYGAEKIADGVDGMELLNEDSDALGEDSDEAWNDEAQGDEDSDGWVKVSSDEENNIIQKSQLFDDEKMTAAEKRLRRKQVREDRGKTRLGFAFDKVEHDDEETVDNSETEWKELDQALSGDEQANEEWETDSDGDDSDGDSDQLSEAVDSDDDEESDHESEIEDENTSTLADSERGRQRPELTRFLTPADFARMKQKKEEAAAERLANGPRKDIKRARSQSPDDKNIVTTLAIEGLRKKQKQNREERLATVMEGKKDREKFGSKKGKDRGSTTNKEKRKTKNHMMIVHKQGLIDKNKLSMRDKQMRKHAANVKQKKRKH